MEQASIVPYHRFAGRPRMVIDARRLAREIHQLLQEALGLALANARNVMRMTTDHQRLPRADAQDLFPFGARPLHLVELRVVEREDEVREQQIGIVTDVLLLCRDRFVIAT